MVQNHGFERAGPCMQHVQVIMSPLTLACREGSKNHRLSILDEDVAYESNGLLCAASIHHLMSL